jgi:ribonuclease HI
MEVTKFRPISLINVVGKVIKKLLTNRIMHHVYKNELLNGDQYGFTPQRNSIDAAIVVKEYLEETLREGKIAIIVTLDVLGVFDSAWWPNITVALQNFKCPKNLYNLVKNYLSERTATICTNNMQIEKEVSKGCPQGSICGPTLWNIQFNALLNLEYEKQTKIIAYADDVISAVKSKTIREAENLANIEMGKITRWAKNNKITFNVNKSNAMLITRRKRKETKEIAVYLNYKKLEQVQSIRYLGITSYSKLNFRQHIIYTSQKCTKLIHVLSRSAKMNWGLSSKALHTIYKGAILPLMTYGVPVWIKALEKNCNRKIYNRVQRLINIKIAKAYRTTSNEALCTLTGLTPIAIKAEEAARIYNIMRDSYQNEIDTDEKINLWLHPAEYVRTIETPENEGKEEDIQIYTDGSKSEDGVGAGIAVFEKGKTKAKLKYKLHINCSNNQAEQLAVVKALEALGNINFSNSTRRIATIHTDSKVTIQSVKNYRNHKSLIETIRKSAIELEKKDWIIQITWIKAHMGHYGNELADKLAKEATKNTEIIY